jgi:hypothetical protein
MPAGPCSTKTMTPRRPWAEGVVLPVAGRACIVQAVSSRCRTGASIAASRLTLYHFHTRTACGFSVPRRVEWVLFGLFLSLLSVCRPWCPRRKGSPRHQLTWRPQSMSLRRQRSAPMLNVEATGSMLIDPIGAGSARPPTSTVTPPYYPPKTSKNQEHSQLSISACDSNSAIE